MKMKINFEIPQNFFCLSLHASKMLCHPATNHIIPAPKKPSVTCLSDYSLDMMTRLFHRFLYTVNTTAVGLIQDRDER